MLIMLSLFASEDNWDIKFALYSEDSTYVDNWNKAGVRSDANTQHDIYDVVKFYPPTSTYAILFFPHRDSLEPDYWPPPHSSDYTRDYRPPLTDTEIWHMKTVCVFSGTHSITLWWSGLDSIPATYLPLLITADNDSINLFSSREYIDDFSAGVRRWKLSVEPSYYSNMSVSPRSEIVYVGEVREFRTYLHHGSDSVRAVHSVWEYHGSGGYADIDGRFHGVSPGGGYIVAEIGGVKDSAEVTVIPGGSFYDIPVKRGWNLISLNADPISPSVGDIYPAHPDFIYYYDPILSEYINPEILEPGKGYFVLSTRDTILTFAGEPLDSTITNLVTGWNMVGGPGDSVGFSDFEIIPPGILFYYPFVWDDGYISTDTLSPEQGCWLMSGFDGVLKIITD